MKLFTGLGSHYEGYSEKNITPYMHIMVYHVPDMIRHYGNIKKFSGQGKNTMNHVSQTLVSLI